tara:strand:+ start:223 stop:522 length:300 start_codon:yes stop_codon:yes gene_type:complete
MEVFENTVANNAGIAKRAIERILEVSWNGKSKEFGVPVSIDGLDQSNIGQLVEVLDTLTLLHAKNNDPLEDELKPKGWQEAANADGYLFNEYHEYDVKK